MPESLTLAVPIGMGFQMLSGPFAYSCVRRFFMVLAVRSGALARSRRVKGATAKSAGA
jgi:hypothetical protein